MAPVDPSAFLPSQVQLMPIYKVSSTSISLTLIRTMTMLNLRVLHPEIFVGVYLIRSCRDRQISESDSHRDIVLSSSRHRSSDWANHDTIHSPPGIGISEGPTCVTIIHFTSLDKVREKNKTASVRGFFYDLTNLNKPPCMAGSPSTFNIVSKSMRKTARLGNSRRAIFHSPAVFKRQ